jgi:hypothetical protein
MLEGGEGAVERVRSHLGEIEANVEATMGHTDRLTEELKKE